VSGRGGGEFEEEDERGTGMCEEDDQAVCGLPPSPGLCLLLPALLLLVIELASCEKVQVWPLLHLLAAKKRHGVDGR
jgi:hypothetical protein